MRFQTLKAFLLCYLKRVFLETIFFKTVYFISQFLMRISNAKNLRVSLLLLYHLKTLMDDVVSCKFFL